MFQLHNVSFAAQTRTLLHSICAEFKTGQVYGLIGHNGSGKSTLIKLLARQLEPTSGDIILGQKKLKSWSSRAFAQKVAYLPQSLPSAAGLTVAELVLMGRFSHHSFFQHYDSEDEKVLNQVLEYTHTTKFRDRFVHTLSGGERQRVWLAMCLAQQSQFLLLDEPISALDIAHQVEVMALVQKLARELKLGIIIVIHDINLAAQYCDQFLALKNGALCFAGTKDDLMKTEVLKDIYDISLSIIDHPITHQAVALI
ncbi:ABC transporter ATP-binding protein [Neisseria sp. Ec49-e6-T10]|uniref:ABC transporter ATP-binding protein n=1 Tax=Neisseria sp. Ec49-e6-T10 TaxID=3140744 RepID=UPI003EBEF41D